MIANADKLFEISWEVCNKVGGIHTVLTSKINPTMEAYGRDGYMLIGPYTEGAKTEFEEKSAPAALRTIFEELRKEGIQCRYGVWLSGNKPYVVLIDFSKRFEGKDGLKAWLWQEFGIDSLESPFDFDEPMVWSHAVGRFIEKYMEDKQDKKAVAHFHEWMTAAGLLYLKKQTPSIATVFTTHATILGRTLSSGNVDIANEEFDPEKTAYRHNMHSKFQAERACVHWTDMFTTVSEITGEESRKLLGREPDMILSNGLDIESFPTFEEASVRHRLFRDKIREFLMAYFFPYYTFDLTQSLTFFSFGRPEYHVKGIDMFIDSLAALNERLKPTDKTVIAFIFVPGDISNIKQEIIENLTSMADIKEELSDNFREIKLNMLSSLLSEVPLRKGNVLPSRVGELIEKRRRKMQRLYKKPPICTHDLHDEENDLIIQHLKRVGLTNERHKKVKVIYYPQFLTGADGLLNTDYYETISGGHLGVFPSFYEPWGYTPLECSAMGVPSITTDMAGFGQYVNTREQRDENAGIFVVDRAKTSYDHATKKIKEYMYWYSQLIRPQRIENKIHAKEIADRLDWKYMIMNYLRVHNEAMQHVRET